MDSIRYVTALAVFLGSSLALAFCLHLLLIRRSKRKNPVPIGRSE